MRNLIDTITTGIAAFIGRGIDLVNVDAGSRASLRQRHLYLRHALAAMAGKPAVAVANLAPVPTPMGMTAKAGSRRWQPGCPVSRRGLSVR